MRCGIFLYFYISLLILIMIRYLIKTVTLSLIVLSLFSCLSSKNASNENADEELVSDNYLIVPDTFVLPDIPEELTNPDARADYLVLHYWDRFDFSNSDLIDKPEITEQAFVDYINILNYASYDKSVESLKHTLSTAEENKEMYIHFCSLFEKYLYSANSPFRNEEFYIPVLEKLLKTDFFSEEQKSTYQLQYDFSQKNRIGYAATDFVYTLSNGESKKMSSINSEFLILFFSNPGCSTCMAVSEAIDKSEQINRALSHNTPQRTMLTVLSVYPDNDIEEWKNYLNRLPIRWVHSYDEGMKITKNKLYDLKAVPTIYLLDKNKKVILKDTSIEILEAFFDMPS